MFAPPLGIIYSRKSARSFTARLFARRTEKSGREYPIIGWRRLTIFPPPAANAPRSAADRSDFINIVSHADTGLMEDTMKNEKIEKKPGVEDPQQLTALIERVRAAQQEYSTFTQEQVDKIFFAAAVAANMQRIPLAKMAVDETGMGIMEDKAIKNHFASEYIYNAYRDVKTCGVIDDDRQFGVRKIAEPVGIICAIIPTTNPTSTAIFAPHGPQDQKRHYPQPAPQSREVHHRRGQGRA